MTALAPIERRQAAAWLWLAEGRFRPPAAPPAGQQALLEHVVAELVRRVAVRLGPGFPFGAAVRPEPPPTVALPGARPRRDPGALALEAWWAEAAVLARGLAPAPLLACVPLEGVVHELAVRLVGSGAVRAEQVPPQLAGVALPPRLVYLLARADARLRAGTGEPRMPWEGPG